ncbi:MAG: rhombosortase [Candidatus Thiodiazotropha sp. (ex Semelilucina semeliformis)]|nr:rhombosortase [Candidatus Thiodiazotropha sp. (ex Myrtea spinifera)]MCU7809179.1 rhombosortase [Candidatus Thiodiazotropha sp. (ex Semelilucina semeliformis)]
MASFLKIWESRGGLLLPWRTLFLTTLALAGYLILGAAPEAWVFDRAAIGNGEVWRLVTGHWVHSDFEHALWDISALVLLGVLFEKYLRGHLLLALGIGTLGVDIWLWWIDTGLHYYCGLSGILNTLLVVGLVQLWRDTRHPLVWFIGMSAIAKILLEIGSGQALLTQTLWPSVPEVHAVGFLTGVMLAIVITTCSHILQAKLVSTQCSILKVG